MYSSDQELIRRVKYEKDVEAFTLIFNKYKGRILGYIYRYIGDFHKAEDLTIHTFMKAYSNFWRYREKGTFSSWLYKIATNCAKSELRKRAIRKEISIDENLSEEGNNTLAEIVTDTKNRPDYTARQRELKEYIYNIVSGMKEKHKTVILLCDIEGLSYEEAAKIIGISVTTVGTRLQRARALLHEILRKRGFRL